MKKIVFFSRTTAVNTTRYYFGEYEKQIKNGTTSHIHYIAADPGLVCIVERVGSTDNYYYTYTDHLGSVVSVTNSSGTVLSKFNYDAWGRERSPVRWDYYNVPAKPGWLYRGYTGHEMMPEFGLINMNGRMYDPVNGRMLSPDNNVQSPYSTQGYNRYSYAMNNPLRYTDPSGEIFIIDDILIGAAIGAAVGVLANGAGNAIHNQPFFQGAGKAALWGAVAGGISGGIGGVASMIEGASAFEVGAFQSIAHGWSGSAMNLMQGQEPFSGFAVGMGSSIGGSFLQNAHWTLQVLGGGVIGGTTNSLLGGSFLDGAFMGVITTGLNHAMHSFLEQNKEITNSEYEELSTKQQRKYIKVPKEALVYQIEENYGSITPTGVVSTTNFSRIEVWGETSWVKEKYLCKSIKTDLLYYDSSKFLGYSILHETYSYYNSWFYSTMKLTGDVLYPSNNKTKIYYNMNSYPKDGILFKYLNILK